MYEKIIPNPPEVPDSVATVAVFCTEPEPIAIFAKAVGMKEKSKFIR